MNTKPHGGQTLQNKHLCLVGYKNYPPKGTKHYELLELGKYNIGVHRGSFLLDASRAVHKKMILFIISLYQNIKISYMGGYWTTV